MKTYTYTNNILTKEQVKKMIIYLNTKLIKKTVMLIKKQIINSNPKCNRLFS